MKAAKVKALHQGWSFIIIIFIIIIILQNVYWTTYGNKWLLESKCIKSELTMLKYLSLIIFLLAFLCAGKMQRQYFWFLYGEMKRKLIVAVWAAPHSAGLRHRVGDVSSLWKKVLFFPFCHSFVPGRGTQLCSQPLKLLPGTFSSRSV